MRRVLTVVWVALAACAFPAVRYRAGADGGMDLDGDVDPEDSGLSDGFIPDTGVGDTKPPLMDTGDPCDKDGDMHKDPSCGGDDCDDTDKRAHPGVTGLQYYPEVSPTFGDWNCDHTIDREVKVFGVACTSYLIATTNCAATIGYDVATVKCGAFANYVTCKNGALLNCDIGTSVPKQQGCL